MKKQLLAGFAMLIASIGSIAMAETVTLNGKNYEVNRLIDRQIAPGVQYTRYRLPSYPLNINVVTVDLTNPYNRIETTVANESAKGTEMLTTAAARQSYEGHRAVAGANANFWVVATQKEYPAYSGTTRNASLRNGKLVTESNQFNDKWDGGTMRTGVVGISEDGLAYVDKCTSEITVTSDAIGTLDVYQCNKGVHPNELCMYNSFFGASRSFMPISDDWVEEDLSDATEVLLDLNEGSSWSGGHDIYFTVREIRLNAGRGKLGQHDLALVGRGEFRDKIAALQVGDQVTMNYNWTFRPNSETNRAEPILENAIGGNAMVMIDGELTTYNTNEAYNSQVYSRTGYGRSADRKTLYICVIDKATDPVYGASAGCSTSVMCEFMRTLGCTDMANFDAGGSAEMFVNGRIINKTTESSPRAVANGFLVYSIAPEDDMEVTSLAFDEITLVAPLYGSYTPRVIGYNKYGFPVDYDLQGFTLSCAPELGSCNGQTFTAGGTAMQGQITAEYNGATVTANIEVLEAQMGLRIKPLLIDGMRDYPIEVTATIGENIYTYDPSSLTWSVEDPEIVSIDGNGVLHGLREGTTTITGSVGEFSDQTTVTVEIAPESTIDFSNWGEGWTAKGASGMTPVSFNADGVLTFNYASPRDANVQVNKVVTFYSLPDRVTLDFECQLPVVNMTFDLRSALHTRLNVVKVLNGTADNFPANVRHEIQLPLSELGDLSDLAVYPITLYYIKATTERNSDYRGEHTLTLGHLVAGYDHFSSGVEQVAVPTAAASIKLNPNPVAAGTQLSIVAEGVQTVSIHAMSGAVVATAASYDGATVEMQAPTVAGMYVVRTVTTNGIQASTLIVK